jgi:Fe2+ or Zn2+ uptake regulation protein
MSQNEIKILLRTHNLRATPARVAVLSYLHKQKHPVGIQSIGSSVPGTNPTTIYRMIDDFVQSGIVHGHDLGHGHNDYEIADRPHHHHLVCESCGLIEDIDCNRQEYGSILTKTSFSKITHHQTTYFGTCKKCS